MPVIVRHTTRVFAARAFIDNVLDESGDQLYIGIGRTASNPWPNEAAPPTPQNTKEEDNGFWSTILGAGRVSQTNATMHGTQSIAWTAGVVYIPSTGTDLDKSDVSVGNQFYVLTSKNKIYTCADNNSGDVVSVEPDHDAGTADPGDGYEWKFEYNAASINGWSTLATLNWMPVPDDGTDDAKCFVLGANYVLVGLKFPDYTNTGDVIANEEYRQIALMKNPLEDDDVTPATAQWLAAADMEDIGGDVSDNIILTLDNRVKITRAEGQSETVVAVLQF
jgi:hypothetical protein